MISPFGVERLPTVEVAERSPNLRAQLQVFLETSLVVADADFGDVRLLDAAGHLNIVAHLGFESWWIEYWQTAAGGGNGADGAALADGGQVVVEDVLTSSVFTNPADRDTMVRAGIRAVQSTPLLDSSGRVLGMFSTYCREAHSPEPKTLKVLDLLADSAAQAIERVQAQLVLTRVETAYEAILDHAPIGIAQMDRVERILSKVNPAFCSMLGYAEDELVGLRMDDITHPDDLQGNVRVASDLAAGKVPAFHIIKRYVHKNGSHVCSEVNVVDLHGVDGGQGTSVVVIRDITENQRLEKESDESRGLLNEGNRKLTEERNFIDTILETQDAFVVVLDSQGRLVRYNRMVERMHGPGMEQLVGTTEWIRDFGDEGPVRLKQALATLAAGASSKEFEVTGYDRLGQPHPLMVRHSAIRDDAGNIQFVIATALDLTEQRQAEAKAREHLDDVFRLQRLNTANELASVLAHELNQPLAAINFYVVAAVQELDKPEIDRAEIKSLMSTISELSSKTGAVIQQSRRFFKRGEFEPEAHDLNAVLQSAISVMRAAAQRQNICIHTELQAELPEVWGVGVHLEQVLLNLLRNALDAIVEQGSGDGEITVCSSYSDKIARVSVSDSGPGISPEQADTLFEMLASRKADGLGVGLRISRSLIEAHEGELWVEARQPGGLFHFEVPLA